MKHFEARSCQDSSSVVEVKKEADSDAPLRQTEESVMTWAIGANLHHSIRLEKHGAEF